MERKRGELESSEAARLSIGTNGCSAKSLNLPSAHTHGSLGPAGSALGAPGCSPGAPDPLGEGADAGFPRIGFPSGRSGFCQPSRPLCSLGGWRRVGRGPNQPYLTSPFSPLPSQFRAHSASLPHGLEWLPRPRTRVCSAADLPRAATVRACVLLALGAPSSHDPLERAARPQGPGERGGRRCPTREDARCHREPARAPASVAFIFLPHALLETACSCATLCSPGSPGPHRESGVSVPPAPPPRKKPKLDGLLQIRSSGRDARRDVWGAVTLPHLALGLR